MPQAPPPVTKHMYFCRKLHTENTIMLKVIIIDATHSALVSEVPVFSFHLKCLLFSFKHYFWDCVLNSIKHKDNLNKTEVRNCKELREDMTQIRCLKIKECISLPEYNRQSTACVRMKQDFLDGVFATDTGEAAWKSIIYCSVKDAQSSNFSVTLSGLFRW